MKVPFCFLKASEAELSTFKSSYERVKLGEIYIFLYCSNLVPIPVDKILFLNPESGFLLEVFDTK